MEISVIIPVFNEELFIEKTLQAFVELPDIFEVIVVDGGSTDNTCELVEKFISFPNIKLVRTNNAGRGHQLHEGTLRAGSEVFWFVHADTIPKRESGIQIKKHLASSEVVGGNFELIFDSEKCWAKLLTWLYPRLRLIGLTYGDSAMFIRREVYEKIGGFQDYPIFEDVDLFRRASKHGRFVTIRFPVVTSSRRFEQRNFGKTFVGWMILQALYWCGVPARNLSKYYLPIRK